MSAPPTPPAALPTPLRADGPFIIVVAGSNGAGKSTFVDRCQRLVGERRSFCMETVLSDPVGEKPRFLRAVGSGRLVRRSRHRPQWAAAIV